MEAVKWEPATKLSSLFCPCVAVPGVVALLDAVERGKDIIANYDDMEVGGGNGSSTGSH